MMSDLPTIIAVLIALIGGLGGIAAIMKVQGDNSESATSAAKSITEGAKTLIEMMNDRLDENEAHSQANTKRLDALEDYVSHFDTWADKLLSILDRAITLLPETLRAQYEGEASAVKNARPKREAAQRAKARDAAALLVEAAIAEKHGN